MAVRIQLLGPVRAWRDGMELDLGGPQQRAVLALLASASAAGQRVSGSEIADGLWGEQPPASADNVIQTYLKRLRRLLEPDRPARTPSRALRRVAGGYLLDTSSVDIDLARFRGLVATAIDAQRGGDQRQAADRLGAALRLFAGPPLADLPSLHSHPRVAALDGERWSAVIRYGEAMLALGTVAEAVPALAEAAAACPFDEALHALLVRGYHALGRREQAFTAYHTVRRRLADELGVDPGPELAAAHAALLADDQDRSPVMVTTAPAQLPMATASFAGRVDQLRSLDKLLPDQHDRTGAVRIATIVGSAGIGKTTLAVRWAHQVADRFPDGQLFLDLRGFDPEGLVTSPADAIHSLLDALQVPPQRIPAGLEARVGLYRSLLSGRRMLVVLDNARDAEQVRPLLPGSPGCLVLVTSRHQLAGLIAAEGAHALRLDLLSRTESRELLGRRLGADRMAAEPAAVAEILERCRGLPLALAIAAARATTRPHLPLASLAGELRQTRDNLDGFEGEEAAADLRAVFSWSMHAITPAAARLFRLLSVHSGPDLAAPAVASLAGQPLRPVQQLLAELTRAHLLTEHATGRYAFHDLMRAYATELAGGVDRDEERRQASRRLLDHYLHTAHAAAVQLEPQRDPITLEPPAAGVTPIQLTDLAQAHGWLAVELPNLVAAAGAAYRAGFDEHAWRFGWSLAGVLDLRGHWQDQISVQATAAEAAVRLGNRQAELRIRMYLAFAQARLSAFDQAHLHLRRAVALADELGDPRGRAHTRSNLGWLRLQQQQHRAALDDYRQAHQLYREAGYTVGEARMLNAIGWIHALLGEYQEALRQCQGGLALMVEFDDRQGQGMAWDSIGYAHLHLGDPRQALTCFEAALALHREVGDRYLESNTLVHIGDAQAELGDPGTARATWQQALSILDELGHPEAEEVRAKLEPGPATSPTPAH